jgi:hypothetical protein
MKFLLNNKFLLNFKQPNKKSELILKFTNFIDFIDLQFRKINL